MIYSCLIIYSFIAFHCLNSLCISTFPNENDLNDHIANEDHHYAIAKSAIDKAILYYASQKQIQSSSSKAVNSNEMDDDLTDNDYTKLYVKGWARKVRTVIKITNRQREFIEKLFKNSKAKLSPEQMAERMKEEIVDGDYYFTPVEYLQPKRIRSLISSLNKKNQQSLLVQQNLSEDDGIEQNLEEICDYVLDSDEEPDFFGFDLNDIFL